MVFRTILGFCRGWKSPLERGVRLGGRGVWRCLFLGIVLEFQIWKMENNTPLNPSRDRGDLSWVVLGRMGWKRVDEWRFLMRMWIFTGIKNPPREREISIYFAFYRSWDWRAEGDLPRASARGQHLIPYFWGFNPKWWNKLGLLPIKFVFLFLIHALKSVASQINQHDFPPAVLSWR